MVGSKAYGARSGSYPYPRMGMSAGIISPLLLRIANEILAVDGIIRRLAQAHIVPGLPALRMLNWPNTVTRLRRFFTTAVKGLCATRSVSSGLSPVTRSTRPSPVLASSTASFWPSVLSKIIRCKRGNRAVS